MPTLTAAEIDQLKRKVLTNNSLSAELRFDLIHVIVSLQVSGSLTPLCQTVAKLYLCPRDGSELLYPPPCLTDSLLDIR